MLLDKNPRTGFLSQHAPAGAARLAPESCEEEDRWACRILLGTSAELVGSRRAVQLGGVAGKWAAPGIFQGRRKKRGAHWPSAGRSRVDEG